jgi:hypothetical protein
MFLVGILQGNSVSIAIAGMHNFSIHSGLFLIRLHLGAAKWSELSYYSDVLGVSVISRQHDWIWINNSSLRYCSFRLTDSRLWLW